ncbi:hypothetical protein E6O75_ATG06538 [Venturia nashicola]|uniref:Uncharacterized protein n=1 Tax=Venturia nashicola TaxID=86259 RepID=A0A4Z1NV71_9PEZI|nr:hypothetical protein E6O75_ATG06538 [Venturia nashicola]
MKFTIVTALFLVSGAIAGGPPVQHPKEWTQCGIEKNIHYCYKINPANAKLIYEGKQKCRKDKPCKVVRNGCTKWMQLVGKEWLADCSA